MAASARCVLQRFESVQNRLFNRFVHAMFTDRKKIARDSAKTAFIALT